MNHRKDKSSTDKFAKRSFYSVFILAFVAIQISSCSGDSDLQNCDYETELVINQDSITEARVLFWDAWSDSCFPGKNWDSTTFTTFGIDYITFKTANSALNAQMSSLYQTSAQAAISLPVVINSGLAAPTTIYAMQGDKFYKIVPKGNTINGYSPYYLTKVDLDSTIANPGYLEQRLGLPLSSCAADYDVFAITSKIDSNILFQATVAPSTQHANATPSILYSAPGGMTQTLIINNHVPLKWVKDTIPYQTIVPNCLPILE